MPYGLKIADAIGNVVQLTSDVANIVDGGTTYMPSTLWPDGTYGAHVKLPGLSNFREEDVGVMLNPKDWGIAISITAIAAGLSPEQWGFFKNLHEEVSHYTYDIANGELTPFAASYDDTIFNQHGIAFWNKLGQTEFNMVTLLCASVGYIFDYSAGVYKKVFMIPTYCPSVDFAIFVKNLR
jgi:hypothetical protein